MVSTKSIPVSARLDPRVVALLRERAQLNDRTLSREVERACRYYIASVRDEEVRPA